MAELTPLQKIQDAAREIRRRTSIVPKIGVILGSGLGSLADQLKNAVAIPYTEIPHFHGTAVEGHAGRLVVGEFEGVPAIFLQGRFHFYEGYSMSDVVLPTRVIHAMGARTLVVTNAAGGINTRFRPTDLMIIEDHLNLMGDNPLRGHNIAELGPRFPDLTEAYSRLGIETLAASAATLSIPVHRGVYAGLLGPSYETPSEIRMYRSLGADAVGMSTVPETIAANHLGMQVAGVSLITNVGAGMGTEKLSHQEVIENSRLGAKKLSQLLAHAIPKIAAGPNP